MTKAQKSEDSQLSLTKSNAQSNPDAAYQLVNDMRDHMLYLNEAHAAIVEIARASSIEDRVSCALELIARDMERSLGAIDQMMTDVGGAYPKERGINRKASSAA
ncbi:hypothetical protein [Pelagibius sp. 7325]|uniref:hypothetical protein n=1 Tax=Pelagibius sp. 7325 TaxID=3131994 RepID=UPI0030EBA069